MTQNENRTGRNSGPESKWTIRTADEADLDAVTDLEAECFPAAEAATRESFAQRIRYYGDCFLLLFEDGKLISFVDGMITDEKDLRDEMYEKADMHDPNGKWQMIFGVNTRPSHQRCGYAGIMIRKMIEKAKEEGRLGVVLTCKDKLVHYYASFGFQNEGVSEASTHGGVTWNQMRLTF